MAFSFMVDQFMSKFPCPSSVSIRCHRFFSGGGGEVEGCYSNENEKVLPNFSLWSH